MESCAPTLPYWFAQFSERERERYVVWQQRKGRALPLSTAPLSLSLSSLSLCENCGPPAFFGGMTTGIGTHNFSWNVGEAWRALCSLLQCALFHNQCLSGYPILGFVYSLMPPGGNIQWMLKIRNILSYGWYTEYLCTKVSYNLLC